MKNKLKKMFFVVIMFTSSVIFAQTAVTGIVSDSDGPLPGANVLVQGTSNGAMTDFDGNFTLNNVPSNGVLIISFVGYETQEVNVANQTTFNVTLQVDANALDEVIVVAYGTSSKKDLTGAVGVIGADEINTFPVINVEEALQGKLAGVQVVANSGAPGSSLMMNIRGVGSFGSTTPLFIVDGYPTQDISYLNPTSIQSISVLKDASAGAIYGVRASNGVVIIETKKGTRNGKVSVEIDSWVGSTSQPKFIDVLDASTFATLATGLANTEGKDYYPAWDSPNSLTNVDWQDYAFDSGFKYGTNVTVRGGGENSRIAFDAGMINEDGVVLTSSYMRYNMGFNADFDLGEDVKITSNIKYSYSEGYGNLGQGYYNLVRLFTNVPHLAESGDVNLRGGVNGTNLPYDGQGNYGGYPDLTSEIFRTSANNLGSALQNDNENGNNTILGNFGVEYSFLDGFSIKGHVGGNVNNYSGWGFSPTYYRSNNNNDFRDTNTYDFTQNTSNEWLAEGILGYKNTFGDHTVDVLVGASAQRNYFKHLRTRGAGFLNNAVRDISQATTIQNAEGYSSTTTVASTFARLNYNYKSKYYLTATIRRDGVGDRFGENNLWGTFPAFALGWNVDQESFMQDSAFDVLKLRASWGETGSYVGINPFSYAVIYSGGPTNNDAGYVFNNEQQPGLYPEALPNPDLKWETQIQTDIGVDIELLDRRLYITADWFKKESSDFLFNETIPPQNGFGSRAVNAGNVVNKGFEFLVGYRKMEGDLTWDVSANITFIDNEITELTSAIDYTFLPADFVPNFVTHWLGFNRSYVGGEVGTFYGWTADGIIQTQAEIDALNATAQSNGNDWYIVEDTAPGDRKFKDIDGDGTITSDDRAVIGSPIPDFYGGINFNLSYKNFDFGLEFYGTYGNDILNFTRVEQETVGGFGLPDTYTNVSTEYYNNYWRGEGTSNTYARAIIDNSGGGTQNNRISSHFVEDGSYLRLRNLRVAYNIPTDIFKNVLLSGVQIYGSGQNLLTFTNYSGWDPEIGENGDINGGNAGVQSRGIDFGAYPVSRSYTLGINLKF